MTQKKGGNESNGAKKKGRRVLFLFWPFSTLIRKASFWKYMIRSFMYIETLVG